MQWYLEFCYIPSAVLRSPYILTYLLFAMAVRSVPLHSDFRRKRLRYIKGASIEKVVQMNQNWD